MTEESSSFLDSMRAMIKEKWNAAIDLRMPPFTWALSFYIQDPRPDFLEVYHDEGCFL